MEKMHISSDKFRLYSESAVKFEASHVLPNNSWVKADAPWSIPFIDEDARGSLTAADGCTLPSSSEVLSLSPSTVRATRRDSCSFPAIILPPHATFHHLFPGVFSFLLLTVSICVWTTVYFTLLHSVTLRHQSEVLSWFVMKTQHLFLNFVL